MCSIKEYSQAVTRDTVMEIVVVTARKLRDIYGAMVLLATMGYLALHEGIRTHAHTHMKNPFWIHGKKEPVKTIKKN